MWRYEWAKSCCASSRGVWMGRWFRWCYTNKAGEVRENLWWEEQRKLTGWLVKTEVGGKTWKLKREITDVWEEAWPNAAYRWFAIVTAAGNEMQKFWLLALENFNLKLHWKSKLFRCGRMGNILEQAFQVLITKKYSLLKSCVANCYLSLLPSAEIQQIKGFQCGLVYI